MSTAIASLETEHQSFACGKDEDGAITFKDQREQPLAQSSGSVLSHGYLPKNATYKNTKPAKRLAKSTMVGWRLPSRRAFMGIAATPRVPITPLTTRMTGKILSCLLKD